MYWLNYLSHKFKKMQQFNSKTLLQRGSVLLLIFLIAGCDDPTPGPPDPPHPGNGSFLYMDDGTYVGQIVDGQDANLANGDPLWIVSETWYYATIAIGSKGNIGYTINLKHLYYDKSDDDISGVLYNEINTNYTHSFKTMLPMSELKALLPNETKLPFLVKIDPVYGGHAKKVGFYLLEKWEPGDATHLSVTEAGDMNDFFVNSNDKNNKTVGGTVGKDILPLTYIDDEEMSSKYKFPLVIKGSSLVIKDSKGNTTGTWKKPDNSNP